ncbi:hypothetical protein AAT19DRAFT_11282 [Rhodotorula toruloides]|uniref:Uncharacterized protein n=1 Tax=Rhodotorula toruloides TaxID=5286 RepID=A0A2S9ZXT5_RHOTO|nr:hypothetical protein AAT19DRAFT_11282 [Rhodotorula toruloides]
MLVAMYDPYSAPAFLAGSARTLLTAPSSPILPSIASTSPSSDSLTRGTPCTTSPNRASGVEGARPAVAARAQCVKTGIDGLKCGLKDLLETPGGNGSVRGRGRLDVCRLHWQAVAGNRDLTDGCGWCRASRVIFGVDRAVLAGANDSSTASSSASVLIARSTCRHSSGSKRSCPWAAVALARALLKAGRGSRTIQFTSSAETRTSRQREKEVGGRSRSQFLRVRNISKYTPTICIAAFKGLRAQALTELKPAQARTSHNEDALFKPPMSTLPWLDMCECEVSSAIMQA